VKRSGQRIKGKSGALTEAKRRLVDARSSATYIVRLTFPAQKTPTIKLRA
jgi:hypothetical protein